MKKILFIFLLLLAIAACNTETNQEDGKLYVVCTTQMIADAVRNIAQDKVEVVSLMGPGVDPHLYKATQGDLQKLNKADIIFYNGLHLEGKMQDVFERLSSSKKVVAVAQNIAEKDLILLSEKGNEKVFDPHIWHSVKLWMQILNPIAATLSEMDTDNALDYSTDASLYKSLLVELDIDVQNKIAAIPLEQRLLITSHDAFNYFGRDYNIEVKGLQGISTVSEVGIKDVTDMVKLLVNRKVKAVFVESSVPKKPLEAVIQGCKQKGHTIKIGGTLFSDAMGNNETPEGKYIGMIKYNSATIYTALK